MENDLTAHFTTAAMVVYVVEWLKSTQWFPWLTADTKNLNRAVNCVAAALVAIGINWSFDSTAGTLVITGLTEQALVHGAYEFMKQLMAQQVLFDGIVARYKPAPVALSIDGKDIVSRVK